MFDKGVTLTVVTLVVFNVVLMICADGAAGDEAEALGGHEGDEGDPASATALCAAVCTAAAAGAGAGANRGLEDVCGFCDICTNFSKGIPLVDHSVTIDPPELICHDAHNLSIGWNLTHAPNDQVSSPLYFSVELVTIGGDGSPKIYYNVQQDYAISTFHDLPPGTSFIATVRMVSSKGWSGMAVSSTEFSTHSLVLDRQKGAVRRVWYDKLLMLDEKDKNGTRVFKVTIHWEPSEALTCAYDVQVISEHNDYPTIQESYAPGRGYMATFIGLEYGTQYHAAVSAQFSDYTTSDSESITFETPTCLDYYKNNLSVCAPPKPVITPAEVGLDVNGSYTVQVNWEKPELQPDQYNVTLVTDSNDTHIKKINGSSRSAFFSRVKLNKYYVTYVEAIDAAGRSTVESRKQYKLPHSPVPVQQPHSSVGGVLVFALAIPACSLLVGVALVVFIYRRHEKIKLYKKERCRYFEELERKAPPESCNVSIRCLTKFDAGLDDGSTLSVSATADDIFELKPERLSLLEALGEGAFGLVRRALLTGERGDEKEVAVKMLKDHPTPDEARQFRCEIEMMKSVGAHPHIVSMLGACTRATSAPRALLVVEYCARGDLQNYLRYAWEVLSTNRKWSTPNNAYTNKTGYYKLESDSNVDMSTFIVNRLYDMDLSAETEITAVDLLSFSRQIAMGMEFLSSNRVVHRDLAARNILVCADKTVKIADFGLSRDIYQNNMYKKTTGGKLPIKWMAIESLTHQVYTTHSDVWSFGVVMWEIITLGGNPYPGVSTGRLLKLLTSGHRMECPTNCSPELYGLMLSCWYARPKNRPTFTEIRRQLDALLNGACSKDYLNLDVLQYKDIEHFRKDILGQPETESKALEKIASSCTDYKKFDSECYVKPISKSSSREALRTTQNHYSDMPMLPPPPAITPVPSNPLGTANRKLLR